MKASLDELERRLQSLIEVRLLTLLPTQKMEDKIARELADAIHTNINAQGSNDIAPNIFTLSVHPNSAKPWEENKNLLDELLGLIKDVAKEFGLKFSADPTLSINSDPNLTLDEVKIIAAYKVNSMAETKDIDKEENASATDMPRNAFLIIGGVKIFQLTQSVINIGRRADNHLVLDDPRISRYHSQIRAIKGRFTLFDLNSTGGTYVNGQRINQTVLYPGDVISLAGLPIIFGQDNPPVADNINNANNPSASSDRPTAILKRKTEELKNK